MGANTELSTENYYGERPATPNQVVVSVTEPAIIDDTPSMPTVDPILLQALGDCHTDSPEWGDDVFQDISNRWEPIFKAGLKKETKEEILKKYLFPKNVPSSKPPLLNPELSAALTEACKNRDSRIDKKQGQLGHAIAAIGKAMSGMINKNMESPDILKTLNDAGKLIADSHYLESDTRRSLIMPLLDKSYVIALKDRKRDNFLFGENLGEFIKSSRGVKKTGQLITPNPPPMTSAPANLNWKGPPRQHQNYRSQAGRGGGQRATTIIRRAPPLPPPPRRPPPRSSVRRTPVLPAASRSRNKT